MGGILASIIVGLMCAAAVHFLPLARDFVPKRLADFKGRVAVPKSFEASLSRRLLLTGSTKDARSWIGEAVALLLIASVASLVLSGSVAAALQVGFVCVAAKWLRLVRCYGKVAKDFEKKLPFALELLSLLLEAGIDFQSAVARLSKEGEILGREMQLLSNQISAGVSRKQALEKIAARWPDISLMQSFCRSVGHREKFGGKLADLLRALAVQARDERWRRAERAGAMAAQKMLFPLVFFIMPPTLLVAFVPVAIKIMNQELWR